MYRIEEIVKRYNDCVSDCVAYQVAVNECQLSEQERFMRNAGEGFSQVLEHSLKLHMLQHDPINFTRYARKPTPEVVRLFYLDDNNQQKSLYDKTVTPGITPTVNFDYIKTHKYELTNASKHEGGAVVPAVVDEYMKQCKLFILEYLDEKAPLRDLVYYMDAQKDSIQNFYVATDHFQRDDRTYILISERIAGLDHHYYRHFSQAPWDVVIDFDNQSGNNGLQAGAYNSGSDVPHIYKTSDVVNLGDISLAMRKPIYYFANGYKNEIAYQNYEDWNKHYYNKLDRFLQTVSQSIVSQRTIVVSLLKDEDYTEALRSILSRHFTNIKIIIANDPLGNLLDLARHKPQHYEHVKSTIEEIDKCISDYLLKADSKISDQVYSVPFIPGEGNGILTKSELEDLEECFEVLHLNIGEGNDEMSESFLRGETPLTWQGAKRGFAAKREHFVKMYEKPLNEIIRNGRGKAYIIHEAGFGGTTVARQLAYTFREQYPVLYLKEYRTGAVIQKLDWLHGRTRKTIVIFMEIPSVISPDDFDNLFKSTNQSRPYVFIGIQRGKNTPSQQTLMVTDWGNDTVLLSDRYLPVIEDRYVSQKRDEKISEVQRILTGDEPSYKRTPFYFGMLTYENDFVAADSFFEKFVKTVENNEPLRKLLIYLTLCDVYADKPLPEAFFKQVFRVGKNNIFKLENYLSENDGIFESLIQAEKQGGARFIRPKYPYFSKDFLRKLLRKENSPEDTGWTENLGTYCKEFIKDTASSTVASRMEEELLQPMFIGLSREREGDRFTELVDEIQDEEKINIFLTLHEQFPDNPHICSHLARYYAMVEKNMETALDYANRAINLSEIPDPLLHHMKGMCLYYIIVDRIDQVKKAKRAGRKPSAEEMSYITDSLLTQSETEFAKSREIQQKAHREDEYGYIPNIKLLIKVFDFYVLVNNETKKNVIANAKEPYILWLDKAHALLEDVRRLHEEGTESELFQTCETDLWAEYEDYSALIEKLNNQLGRSQHPALVRRQLALMYMRRDDDYKTSPKANERILTLMGDNMKSDGHTISNFLLWFKAARYSSLNTDDMLTRLAQWHAVHPAIDLAYYSFVFNAIKAIEGSSEAAELANKYLRECRQMGGSNHISVKEWYGNAPQGIVSSYEKRETPYLYDLYDVKGYVREYYHSGNAVIELDCGLDVFFKPSLNGLTDNCRNHNVKFKLGFSYDGLQAENESVVMI